MTIVLGREVDGAIVQHLFSTFSSLCLGIKTVYNYGHGRKEKNWDWSSTSSEFVSRQ